MHSCGEARQRQRGSGARRQGHVSSGTWCWSDTKRDSDRSASGFLDGQRSPRVRPDQIPRCTDEGTSGHESPPLRICRPGTRSAGIDYPRLIEGKQGFVMFWWTLPWDHAPGGLLVNESGECVRRLNGDAYSPSRAGPGLIAAASWGTWQVVRHTLLGDLRPGDGDQSHLGDTSVPENSQHLFLRACPSG